MKRRYECSRQRFYNADIMQECDKHYARRKKSLLHLEPGLQQFALLTKLR